MPLLDRIRQRTLEYTRGLTDSQIDDLDELLRRDHTLLLFTRRGHRFFVDAVSVVKVERAQALREEHDGRRA